LIPVTDPGSECRANIQRNLYFKFHSSFRFCRLRAGFGVIRALILTGKVRVTQLPI
jgi:hypothetical protein